MRDEKEFWELEKEEKEKKLKEINGLSQKSLIESLNESVMKKMIGQSQNLDINKIIERFSTTSTSEISKAQEINEKFKIPILDKLTEHQKMFTEINTGIESQLKKSMGVDFSETLTKMATPKTMVEEINNVMQGKIQLETNTIAKMLELSSGRKFIDEADKILKEKYNISIKESQKAFDDLCGKNLKLNEYFTGQLDGINKTIQDLIGKPWDVSEEIRNNYGNAQKTLLQQYSNIKQDLEYFKNRLISNNYDAIRKIELRNKIVKYLQAILVLSNFAPGKINRKRITLPKNFFYLNLEKLNDHVDKYKTIIESYYNYLPIKQTLLIDKLSNILYEDFTVDGSTYGNLKKWIDVDKLNYPSDLPDHARIIVSKDKITMDYFIEERCILVDAYFFSLLAKKIKVKIKMKKPLSDLSSLRATQATFAVSAITSYVRTYAILSQSQKKQNCMNNGKGKSTVEFDKTINVIKEVIQQIPENTDLSLDDIKTEYYKHISKDKREAAHLNVVESRMSDIKRSLDEFFEIAISYAIYVVLRNCLEHFNAKDKSNIEKDEIIKNIFSNETNSFKVWATSEEWLRRLDECRPITIKFLKLYWEYLYGKDKRPEYMFNFDEKLIKEEAQKKVDVYLKALC